MDINGFLSAVEDTLGIDTYYGVPDSLLKALGDELYARYGIGSKHVISADEGGAVGLAAGHYLATGKSAAVYMQNSGIGNAVNPICSLLNEKVYAIPTLIIVGWRGEPGVHDEPQHVFQGECSEELLKSIGLSVDIIDEETTAESLAAILESIAKRFAEGKSASLLVRKGALTREEKPKYTNSNTMTRESIVEAVTEKLPANTAIVSTTGKLSRELFEIRERRGESHESDFLTVGSMGHSSMIGLGIALAQPERPVLVFDGDGAVLMHMGAMPVLSSLKPSQLVHILVNNEAHESVGGLPTSSGCVDWAQIARACGYKKVCSAQTKEEIDAALGSIDWNNIDGPVFIEIAANLESRADLGRPTTSAYDNGKRFQAFLSE